MYVVCARSSEVILQGGKWYVVAKCLPFSHSFAIPYYNICAGVLGHNFDLNFDAMQTAEECIFLKNSSEYLGCIEV